MFLVDIKDFQFEYSEKLNSIFNPKLCPPWSFLKMVMTRSMRVPRTKKTVRAVNATAINVSNANQSNFWSFWMHAYLSDGTLGSKPLALKFGTLKKLFKFFLKDDCSEFHKSQLQENFMIIS